MEDKTLNLAKRRGFIWGPSPGIYHGGVSGFYDWGPLGKLLKNKNFRFAATDPLE